VKAVQSAIFESLVFLTIAAALSRHCTTASFLAQVAQQSDFTLPSVQKPPPRTAAQSAYTPPVAALTSELELSAHCTVGAALHVAQHSLFAVASSQAPIWSERREEGCQRRSGRAGGRASGHRRSDSSAKSHTSFTALQVAAAAKISAGNVLGSASVHA